MDPEELRDHSRITSIPPLAASDVCQLLRDITLGRRVLKRGCVQTWDEIYTGLSHIEVEGWQLVFFNDCGKLDCCDQCISPDGRRWSFESVGRDGFCPDLFAEPPRTSIAGAASPTTVSRVPPSTRLALIPAAKNCPLSGKCTLLEPPKNQ